MNGDEGWGVVYVVPLSPYLALTLPLERRKNPLLSRVSTQLRCKFLSALLLSLEGDTYRSPTRERVSVPTYKERMKDLFPVIVLDVSYRGWWWRVVGLDLIVFSITRQTTVWTSRFGSRRIHSIYVLPKPLSLTSGTTRYS